MNWAVPLRADEFTKAVLTGETVPSFQGLLEDLSDGRSGRASRHLIRQQGAVVIDEYYHKNEEKPTSEEKLTCMLAYSCRLPSRLEQII